MASRMPNWVGPSTLIAEARLMASTYSAASRLYSNTSWIMALRTLLRRRDVFAQLRRDRQLLDAAVLELLRAIHAALPAGGHLLLAEPMAEPGGQASRSDAYFHFYLLAMGCGRLRTPNELSQMMAQAGFTHIEEVPNAVPLQTQILLGRKSRCFP